MLELSPSIPVTTTPFITVKKSDNAVDTLDSPEVSTVADWVKKLEAFVMKLDSLVPIFSRPDTSVPETSPAFLILSHKLLRFPTFRLLTLLKNAEVSVPNFLSLVPTPLISFSPENH